MPDCISALRAKQCRLIRRHSPRQDCAGAPAARGWSRRRPPPVLLQPPRRCLPAALPCPSLPCLLLSAHADQQWLHYHYVQHAPLGGDERHSRAGLLPWQQASLVQRRPHPSRASWTDWLLPASWPAPPARRCPPPALPCPAAPARLRRPPLCLRLLLPAVPALQPQVLRRVPPRQQQQQGLLSLAGCQLRRLLPHLLPPAQPLQLPPWQAAAAEDLAPAQTAE
jgi:hypothetical protein